MSPKTPENTAPPGRFEHPAVDLEERSPNAESDAVTARYAGTFSNYDNGCDSFDVDLEALKAIAHEASKLPPLPDAVRMSPRDAAELSALLPAAKPDMVGGFAARPVGALDIIEDADLVDGPEHWRWRVRGEWVSTAEVSR